MGENTPPAQIQPPMDQPPMEIDRPDKLQEGMARIDEQWSELRGEIQKFLESNVVGKMTLNDTTLQTCVKLAEGMVHASLPDFDVKCINPRVEGDSIVWDGFLITPKEVEHERNE